jgi:hypothetical protein
LQSATTNAHLGKPANSTANTVSPASRPEKKKIGRPNSTAYKKRRRALRFPTSQSLCQRARTDSHPISAPKDRFCSAVKQQQHFAPRTAEPNKPTPANRQVSASLTKALKTQRGLAKDPDIEGNKWKSNQRPQTPKSLQQDGKAAKSNSTSEPSGNPTKAKEKDVPRASIRSDHRLKRLTVAKTQPGLSKEGSFTGQISPGKSLPKDTSPP